jgi:hypothetical protein
MMTRIPCDTSDPVRIELCIGGCQNFGAVELLGHLLKRHAERREAGEPRFGIVAQRCLDHCDKAALVLLRTPNGVAGLPRATVADMDAAIAHAFEA